MPRIKIPMLLYVAGIFVSLPVFGRVSYRLTVNESPSKCHEFVRALKDSGIAKMSNGQFCGVMNSPVSSLLKSKRIGDYSWSSLVYSGKVELAAVAKKIMVARFGQDFTTKHPGSEKGFATEIHRLMSIDPLVLEGAKIDIDGNSYFAQKIRVSDCGTTAINKDGLPMWGLFRDPEFSRGATPQPFTPSGNPFLMDGKFAVFSMASQIWYPVSYTKPQKMQILISLFTVDNAVVPSGGEALSTDAVCAVVIQR